MFLLHDPFLEQITSDRCSCRRSHFYCPDCDQSFEFIADFIEHRRVPHTIHHCGYCTRRFSHRSGLIQHYESGACRSGLNRFIIKSVIHNADHNRLITARSNQTITSVPALATKQSWDQQSQRYKCFLCSPAKFGFSTLSALNQHISSPVHEEKSYRCPQRLCRRPFSTIGGLVQHIESRQCCCMAEIKFWTFMLGDWQGGGLRRESADPNAEAREKRIEDERVKLYSEMAADRLPWAYAGETQFERICRVMTRVLEFPPWVSSTVAKAIVRAFIAVVRGLWWVIYTILKSVVILAGLVIFGSVAIQLMLALVESIESHNKVRL